MSILQAIVLGLVQGLSEFLPISSSGHLLITRWIFGWDELPSDIERSFDVALHFGTLVAVVGYFWRDIATYFAAGFRVLVQRRRPRDADERVAWLLVLATIPAVVVGLLFEDFIDEKLGGPVAIALSLIGFGLLLGWADRQTGTTPVDGLTPRRAMIIGMAQALALNPGTSRSGITMTAARQLGFGRAAAARLSFLLSLPVIAGAVVLKVGGLLLDGIPQGLAVPMLVGVATAALSGLLAVWATLRIVQTYSFMPFVIYRVVVGVAILIVVAAGWR